MMKALRIMTLMFGGACLYIAMCLAYKVSVANEMDLSLADDPFELWISIGVVFLLVDRFISRISGPMEGGTG